MRYEAPPSCSSLFLEINHYWKWYPPTPSPALLLFQPKSQRSCSFSFSTICCSVTQVYLSAKKTPGYPGNRDTSDRKVLLTVQEKKHSVYSITTGTKLQSISYKKRNCISETEGIVENVFVKVCIWGYMTAQEQSKQLLLTSLGTRLVCF